ncbi:MAG: hypothetical protein LBR65_02105 [Culturomica sp.]|nr:hypothetical protein [Culturomica sp.]
MENFEDKYEKKNPFTVPEGYFDRLTEEVMERVKAERSPRRITLLNAIKPYLGLTAMFVFAWVMVQLIAPRFMDSDRMLKQETEELLSGTGEAELDVNFNPTGDEILEYLSDEVDDYELLYADLY